MSEKFSLVDMVDKPEEGFLEGEQRKKPFQDLQVQEFSKFAKN